MPHLMIDYSRNLESQVDIAGLCDALRVSAIETGVFPEAGVRVRAVACDHWAIADGKADRAFIDISVRLRGGRTLDVRKAAVADLFAAAEAYLADALDRLPLALSLEMRDIDPELSPKRNEIRTHIERGK